MLSRDECLKILELSTDADSYEIESRYTLLIKRYRGDQSAEAIAKLDQISLAYNILTGRYLEPEAPNPRQDKIVFGKSRRHWANIWHYGRLPLLLGLIGAIFLGYVVYTIVTHKDPDFQIVFVGQVALTENSYSQN